MFHQMATLSQTSSIYLNNPSPPLISPRPFHPVRPSLRLRTNPHARLRRHLAASPGPPSPPPESDPPSQNGPIRLSGLAGTFSRFQDRFQIFFAVLFWMSLLFWASAWDGSSGDRPNKGSRFRR